MPKPAILRLRPTNRARTPWMLPIPKYLQPSVKAQKLYFKSERQGLEFTRKLRNKVLDYGTRVTVLTAAETFELGSAKELLKPFAKTILEAITDYVALLKA